MLSRDSRQLLYTTRTSYNDVHCTPRRLECQLRLFYCTQSSDVNKDWTCKQWRQRVSNIGGTTLPFSPHLPSPPHLTPCPPSPPLLLEVGSLNPARRPGALLAPPAGSGEEPQPKSNLVHFSLKIRHLMATILMIFLRVLPKNFL